MRRYSFSCAMFIAVVFIITGGISQAFDTSLLIAPKEVEQAARAGLSRYLNTLTSKEELQAFNFHKRDDLKKAKVGTPFRIFAAPASVILRGDPQKELIDCVYPMPEWFFPIISDGETRTMLLVAFMENKKWMAGGIGDTHLVKPYAEVLTKWPASQGYKHVYVRNNETFSEFVILLREGETKVVPLYSAMLSWGLKEQRVMEQSEAITLLRERLKRAFREPNPILH